MAYDYTGGYNFTGADSFANKAQTTALTGNLSSLPDISQLTKGINALNLGYQTGAIPNYAGLTGNVSDIAARLLNPADAQANYDVSMHGAESAAGLGIVGSGAAAEATGRLRQSDIERRAMLGNELLSSQVKRLPEPFKPATQLLDPSNLSALDAQLIETLIRRGPFGPPGLTYEGLPGQGRGGGPQPGEPVVNPPSGQPINDPRRSPPSNYRLTPAGGEGGGGSQDIYGGLTPEEYAASIGQPPPTDYGGLTPEEYAASIGQTNTVSPDFTSVPDYYGADYASSAY